MLYKLGTPPFEKFPGYNLLMSATIVLRTIEITISISSEIYELII